MKALQSATDYGISQVQVEVDSALLQQALLTSWMDLAVSGMLIWDRWVLFHEHFVCDDVLLVPKNCNSAGML